ncbi:MAG TPA: ASCH domain-containing protein [Myxococcota bacterium]
MMFTKRLREPVMRGEVTTSIRIWQKPHVKVGGLYALGPGHIRVTSIQEIALSDVTPAMARASGFAGVVDLLKTAKHGPGEHVYLVTFHFEESAVC